MTEDELRRMMTETGETALVSVDADRIKFCARRASSQHRFDSACLLSYGLLLLASAYNNFV